MATLSAGKIVATYLEEAAKSFESQRGMLDYVKVMTPDPAEMQNSSNSVLRRMNQQGASIAGFDLTGLETGLIQECYVAGLGTPDNAFVSLRADDLRDISYVRDQAVIDGEKRASVLNKAITDSLRLTSSMFYRTNVTSGYDAISLAQASMNKRQIRKSGRIMALNDSDLQLYSKDLASRSNLVGQPEKTYQTGQLFKQIAGFESVIANSSLSALVGGADPATTVTGNQSFSPIPVGTVTAATNTVVNADYRTMTINVAASASYNIGDRVTFANGGVTVKAVGRDDKTVTDEALSAVVVSKPSGTSIEFWPKFIAADDPGLSTLEKAYANCNTRILNAATVNRLNTDASNQPNIFWQKDSIEVFAGTMPIEKLAEWGSMKTAKEKLTDDLYMYMLYDANIASLQARWRMFIWYGVNNARPMDNGAFVSF